MWKSRNYLKLIAYLTGVLTLAAGVYCWTVSNNGTKWDFLALDLFFKRAVILGYGPNPSSRIVHLDITNETYNSFGKTFLSRSDLALVNNVLTKLNPHSVAYDMIFVYPGEIETDLRFQKSLIEFEKLYLPIGFTTLADQPPSAHWGRDTVDIRFRKFTKENPKQSGSPQPIYGSNPFMSTEQIFKAAYGSGHINTISDNDGVHRHSPLLIKVESGYVPSLPLVLFLDYVRIPFSKIEIDWGNQIKIPRVKGSYLNEEVIIPIDARGRTYIPFVGQGFNRMSAHRLLAIYQDENLRGNLTDFFESNIVIISDVSQNAPDIGRTPLEIDVPLSILHSSVLNGFLTQTFYREWSLQQTIWLIVPIGFILGISATPKRSWSFYFSVLGIIVFLVWFTWNEFIHFKIFPIVTVLGATLWIFFGLVFGMQVITARDRQFIKNAFSKYVPAKVVDQILSRPEILTLGGEERVLTVLFSDIEGFTQFSEKMSPPNLVKLMNDYFTEMTKIVWDHGGIIIQYSGDSVMAEFGAPVFEEDHPDKAVLVGLNMLRRLRELSYTWKQKDLPLLRCRIGINTGPMVLGNLGSKQVFYYSVMGDSVNLAARLESANKLFGTNLMISEFTLNHLTPNRFRWRLLDVIKVKGKTKPVKVYEVYGETSEEILEQNSAYYKLYSYGYKAYLNRDFNNSIAQFNEALSFRQNDPAANQMIDRINRMDKGNLPDDWDGSIQLLSK